MLDTSFKNHLVNSKTTTFNVDVFKLSQNMLGFSKLGKVYYPLKSNGDIEILEELIRLSNELRISDFGFLITSLEHFNKLKSLGVNVSKMGVINVLLDDNTIRYLYDEGVRYFTFHNLNQIINFAKYADLKLVKINVRLNIKEVFDQFSHLGASKEEAKQMLVFLQALGCNDYGISFYLQKEIVTSPNSLNEMLDFIQNNFKGYKMNFVNIGGAKKHSEIDESKLEEIKDILQLDHIVLEPARYLVGNAIEMETKISEVKGVDSDYCIIIQNGLYSGLVDTLLYSKKFEYYLKNGDIRIPLKHNQESPYDFEFYMCGASSDSGDRLGKFYIDEEYSYLLKEGETIVIQNAGTYVSEFFMPLGGISNREYNFGRQKVAEERNFSTK